MIGWRLDGSFPTIYEIVCSEWQHVDIFVDDVHICTQRGTVNKGIATSKWVLSVCSFHPEICGYSVKRVDGDFVNDAASSDVDNAWCYFGSLVVAVLRTIDDWTRIQLGFEANHDFHVLRSAGVDLERFAVIAIGTAITFHVDILRIWASVDGGFSVCFLAGSVIQICTA